MSKIIVDTIESSGTTVTIADNTTVSGNVDAGTNAVTAGSVTGITAASITSGTLGAGASITNASLPAGHVLQAVTDTLTAAESWGSSTGGWQAIGTSGCEVTITPSSTDSKILIIYSCGGLNSNNGSTPATRIYRSISGGTAEAPLVATSAGSRLAGQTLSPGYVGGDLGSGQIGFDTGSHFLDSPSSTAAITYSIQWGGRTDTGVFTNYIGRTVTDNNSDYMARAVTTITALEIGG